MGPVAFPGFFGDKDFARFDGYWWAAASRLPTPDSRLPTPAPRLPKPVPRLPKSAPAFPSPDKTIPQSSPQAFP